AEGHRRDAERAARPAPLLVVRDWLSSDVRRDARPRSARHAAADLHLRTGARVGHAQSDRLHRRIHPGRRGPRVRRQSDPVVLEGRQSRQGSVGRVDARVVRELAAASLQLRSHPGGRQPAPAVGSQTSGSPRQPLRVKDGVMRAIAADIEPTRAAAAPAVWTLPDRGTVGMVSFIIAESAIFTIFVVAYLFYLGKSVTGPTPGDVLETPVFYTICLPSTSL